MPLNVSCRCAYFVGDYSQGVPGHVYQANKYVNALKGRDVNGYADIPVRTKTQRLNQATRHKAVGWFGLHAADLLEAAGVKPPFQLVPIPNSGAGVGTDVVSRTVALAEAVEEAIDRPTIGVLDVIRWDVPLESARGGAGPRFADQLYPHVHLADDFDETERIVLVDDVLTSGGHLKAVAAKLRAAGADVIHAVVGGRTVHEVVPDSWAPIVEPLDDFDPDWL
jgi:Phosphoribosyl transferase domain